MCPMFLAALWHSQASDNWYLITEEAELWDIVLADWVYESSSARYRHFPSQNVQENGLRWSIQHITDRNTEWIRLLAIVAVLHRLNRQSIRAEIIDNHKVSTYLKVQIHSFPAILFTWIPIFFTYCPKR